MSQWIDPGAEYPWLIPATKEPPDREPEPTRLQLTIASLLHEPQCDSP